MTKSLQEHVEEAIRETLTDSLGAGSDLRKAEEQGNTWMEVEGNLDIPHLASVVIDTVREFGGTRA